MNAVKPLAVPGGQALGLWQWHISNILRTQEKSKKWFLTKINATKPLHVFTAHMILEILIIIFGRKQA